MPKENKVDLLKRVKTVIKLLKKHYPDAKCSLNFRTTHQLMVATILSAQCTDDRVNKTTPELFKKYKSVKSFAEADINQLSQDIYTTGFHNAKAKSIKNSAIKLIELYNGQIPKNLSQLVILPGVGRKTASVILGAGYALAEGIVVDTHVGRISRHLKFSNQKDPAKVEKDLMKIIPENDWIIYSHLLINHGRNLCKARKPECKKCFLNKLCPSAKL